MWFLGKQELTKKQELESLEINKLLSENDRVNNLINQKISQGETFDRFSNESLGRPYTTSDLLITKDENQATIKAYAKNISKILTNIAISSRNPSALMLETYESQDSESLNELIILASLYEQTTNSLASTSVPPSATTAHLRLINNVREISSILSSMSQVQTEPLKAFEASKFLYSRLEGFGGALNFLNDYFIDKNIVFSSNEQLGVPQFTN